MCFSCWNLGRGASFIWRSNITKYVEALIHLECSFPPFAPRLSDLYRSIGSHVKHHTLAPTPDEEVDVGAWPAHTGDHKGGKKGDIFKLVSLYLSICLAAGGTKANT